MPDETSVHFIIDAQVVEPLRTRYTSELYNATTVLLREIEHGITGEPARAEWKWDEDYHLPLIATVNGVSHDVLQRIAYTAQDALDEARAPDIIRQIPPPSVLLTDGARRAIKRILRVLDHVDAITVAADGRPEIRLESATVTEEVGRARTRRVHSTVEGHLATLSDRRTFIYGRVIELGTNRPVWCRFPMEQADAASGMFRRNVIVSGMVAYDGTGNALSVIDIDSIEERERNYPLAEAIGMAPSLLGDRSPDDFIRVLREDDD